MNHIYKQGFDAGYQFSVNNWSARTGRYSIAFPQQFNHRADHWSAGFGEGLISGRGKVLQNTFPGWKEISWVNGQAQVSY